MIEIAQLKEDNKRLMDMLRNTREFKDFTGFVDDSGGDVRLLEGPQRRPNDLPSNNQQMPPKPSQTSFTNLKQTGGSRPGSRNRANSVSKPSGEKGAKSSQKTIQAVEDAMEGDEDQTADNWIPNTAYNLAHSFRAQHGDELSTELVNEMLRDLNRIYRDREKKQATRLKQQAQEQVNKLKRKLSFRPSYDEITAKKNK